MAFETPKCLELRKAPTGISGLDEITQGGLPAGRPTLVAGGPGSGKTLLGMTFLVNGATLFDEPGVLMTFEENAEELTQTWFRSASTCRGSSTKVDWSSITSTSSAAKSKRLASTISKGCLYAWITPCAPWALNGSCSTPSNRCSVAS